MLNCIRIIWTNSDHYRSRERLTALLRKFSNEIIMRCCTKISLDDIFSGNTFFQKNLVNKLECNDKMWSCNIFLRIITSFYRPGREIYWWSQPEHWLLWELERQLQRGGFNSQQVRQFNNVHHLFNHFFDYNWDCIEIICFSLKFFIIIIYTDCKNVIVYN